MGPEVSTPTLGLGADDMSGCDQNGSGKGPGWPRIIWGTFRFRSPGQTRSVGPHVIQDSHALPRRFWSFTSRNVTFALPFMSPRSRIQPDSVPNGAICAAVLGQVTCQAFRVMRLGCIVPFSQWLQARRSVPWMKPSISPPPKGTRPRESSGEAPGPPTAKFHLYRKQAEARALVGGGEMRLHRDHERW